MTNTHFIFIFKFIFFIQWVRSSIWFLTHWLYYENQVTRIIMTVNEASKTSEWEVAPGVYKF